MNEWMYYIQMTFQQQQKKPYGIQCLLNAYKTDVKFNKAKQEAF